jgi:peptidoglycan hydrolase-like protein with peptidoglycan-binding domain
VIFTVSRLTRDLISSLGDREFDFFEGSDRQQFAQSLITHQEKSMNYNQPLLKQGDTGSAVAVLQRLLILYGHDKFDGQVGINFGPKTEKAVREFQQFQNMPLKDGIVGEKTWHQLAHPARQTASVS